ncbi:uncharacterized protein BXZ73DRAFT_76275 [Epithele typhae]|uniref:uncharacterized protein n=1 Tax=Epithele typhae TaxID=378194 RepID=UPI0020084EFA|nr:uncharacterized protein BXZ73DRAFT_76275 [Epithele typhae]KAH9938760.1 hypothetical protein BXZ73DRAFT_76275 [Epithele typhae]
MVPIAPPRQNVHALDSDSDGDSGPRMWKRMSRARTSYVSSPSPFAPRPLPRPYAPVCSRLRTDEENDDLLSPCPLQPSDSNGQISKNAQGDDAQRKPEPVQDLCTQPGALRGSQHLAWLSLLHPSPPVRLPSRSPSAHDPRSSWFRADPCNTSPRRPFYQPRAHTGRLLHPVTDAPDTYTSPAHEPDFQTLECVARVLISVQDMPGTHRHPAFASNVDEERAKLLDAPADQITLRSADDVALPHEPDVDGACDLPAQAGGLGLGLRLPPFADRNTSISRDHSVPIEDEGIALRRQPQGHHRKMTINVSPVGRSVEETIRLLKAFEHTDEHGKVCPANWSEGAKTMRAGPTESLEIFAGDENGDVRKKRARTG